jgi:hypothetical protein
MSNDAQKVLESLMWLLNGTFAPLQIIGVIIYLAFLIDVKFFLFFLFIPYSIFIFSIFVLLLLEFS